MKKNPDRLLSMGTDILTRRIKAKEITLHLSRVAVEGSLIYTHDPKNRNLDIYEDKHVQMVPKYVNTYFQKNIEKPETLKVNNTKILMFPLVSRHNEQLGVLEIKCPCKKKMSKIEIEEIEYYAEAFVSIIDDYRKQKEHIGYMRDLTGLVILLIMWTLLFLSISIIYSFSPAHYNVIYFLIMFFILSTIFIIFEEHLYTLEGWGLNMKVFLKDLPFYIGISLIVVIISALIKYFGWFGIPKDLGGSLLVFNWTWRDIFYPISVPLQEMGARAVPHTILRHVLKGWHKPFTIIMISSLVFGFSHISFGFVMVILTFLLGIILGALFEWKRNFWGICLVHMIIGYLVMTGLGYEILAFS